MFRLARSKRKNRKYDGWIGLAIACALWFPGSTKANDLRLLASESAPIAFKGENGKISGIGVDLALEMARRSGLSIATSEIASTARLYETAKTDPILMMPVLRTPAREDELRWIGPITESSTCFYTLRSTPPITSIEDAKQRSGVGVNQGGSVFRFLQSQGFSNIQQVSSDKLNVDKLVNGRIDAWYTVELFGRYMIKQAGADPNQFVCTASMGSNTYWIAASKTMTGETASKLTAIYQSMMQTGVIAATLARYQ